MTAPTVVDTIQPGNAALFPASATLAVDDDAAAARGNTSKPDKSEPPVGDQSLRNVASASAAVLGASIPASHFASDHEKTVKFQGLYVVRGPTASKNVHYMMDISIPEWSLCFRVAQRFRSFRQLRQRLLKVLKQCPGAAARSRSLQLHRSGNAEVMNGLSPGKELLRMIAERASGPCSSCSATRKMAAAMTFPKRKFVFTNRQDVHARTLMLEAFLGYCIQLLLHWTGCKRSRMAWATVLDVFLDSNLREFVRADPTTADKRDPSEDRATVDSWPLSSGDANSTVLHVPLPAKTEVPMLVLPQHSTDLDSDYEHTTDAMFSFISIDSSALPLSSSAVHHQ